MNRENEPTYATATAVAGLAGEIEGLRRRLDNLDELPSQIQELAELFERLTGQVDQLTSQPKSVGIPSWLVLPEDHETVETVFAELGMWLTTVFLRYTDAAAALPDCWAWHPDVIEELLWLMHAWRAAYQGKKASAALAGDWHDRYRPGVVRRLKASVGKCSLENHAPGYEPVRLPLAEQLDSITHWWAHHRQDTAPEPTEAQFATVPSRRRGGGGYR